MKSIIYGLHAVKLRLKSAPLSIEEVLIHSSKKGTPKLQSVIELAKSKKLPIRFIERKELDQLAQDGIHQGVILVCQSTNNLIDQSQVIELVKDAHNPLVLVLDGITDPHNLGACLRSAEASNVTCVILPKDKSAPLNATVSKVASGAAEVIPICYVTNLVRALEELKSLGVWLMGMAGEAKDSLYEHDLNIPLGLIMGSEGDGLRRLTRETCDYLVKLPMLGQVESLNVSVATGIALYEILRQR
ncbi:23S rRNA (guanosine(2251)-2'-O)-methyltransferase RlmB [Thiotrichales bacterium 19S11-10]|nr:23S rRNA (guanosine(2251)-2'-O)-methyltransferase RlmB [Thiotrichales bacterium 19S11-10]MCF6807221.1 23S rRNA (guanosine(2251)-2'-O)-methyltransferase RlmB [Thiotrichales bacterium 19S9-11]MCF6811190.1 23S rRNA (guanosine(2251)-2'-O)-methyltransferase RlmB [Thiotrichales bacterium 19S9-12]